MFNKDIAFYLGKEKEDGFSGFIDEGNFFLVIEIEAGLIPKQGREFLSFVKEKIALISCDNLHKFDSFLVEMIKEKNLPASFSLAAGFLKDNIFYLKTAGTGRIYIKRKEKLSLLISSDETASGYIENDDFFILTTDKFIELIGGEEELKKNFDHRSPNEIIEEITPALKAKDDQGTTAIFLRLSSLLLESETDVIPEKTLNEPEESKGTTPESYMDSGQDLRVGGQNRITTVIKQKKTLTFITVFIIGVILFWSVGLGYQRRSQETFRKQITLAKELISQKLNQAAEVSDLNMGRALILIAESKTEVDKLTPLRSTGFASQVKELEKMITDSENKIIKKEEKNFTEFFDLTIDDKNAKGDKLYLNDNELLISDRERGVLYELSLDKKSLDKDQFNAVKRSSFIALYDDKKYFFVTGEGVYQVAGGQAKKVIDKDSDWGEITNMTLYNGNIYLLDKGKDEIYKYLVTESGFSPKNSYFKAGQAVDLEFINSMAIDGSVYLSASDFIVKFTAGLRDGFSMSLPDSQVKFNKIFTNQNLEKVYGWDKEKGTIYVMAKDGQYQEQINSKILSQGIDFTVYNNSIYVLQGSKIYKID
jgi:hypothetical protein